MKNHKFKIKILNYINHIKVKIKMRNLKVRNMQKFNNN